MSNEEPLRTYPQGLYTVMEQRTDCFGVDATQVRMDQVRLGLTLE